METEIKEVNGDITLTMSVNKLGIQFRITDKVGHRTHNAVLCIEHSRGVANAIRGDYFCCNICEGTVSGVVVNKSDNDRFHNIGLSIQTAVMVNDKPAIEFSPTWFIELSKREESADKIIKLANAWHMTKA